MRRLIIIPLLLIYFSLSANTYYVATTGNNSNPGTIGSPWLTWQKAFFTALAGDTVFFRGGIYPMYPTDGWGIIVDSRYPATNGHSGTAENPICYFNYPGEVPILDHSNATSYTTNYVTALTIQYTQYLHIKGLTIRNVFQEASDETMTGFWLRWNVSGVNIIENMTIHNVAGEAFSCYPTGTEEIYYINCDAYNCIDTISPYPGQYGSGFGCGGVTSNTAYISYYGCRAWNCSDQGWSGRTWSYENIENCWAFNNKGDYLGDGHGFKPSAPDVEQETNPPIQRRLVNCIAVNNVWSGFDSNDLDKAACRMLMYNNFAYHNGYGSKGSDAGTGFRLLGASSHGTDRILRNNLAYANEYQSVSSATYTHSNNSWDSSPSVTVTAGDFVSLDTLQLFGARQADGSLPDITFGKLVLGSDLIDRGLDVGLPYAGDAPDLGYAEYGEIVPPSTDTDIITFSFPEQTGSATVNATTHTVTIEVEWDADITDLTPTITLSYEATIDPLSGVSQDFTSPVVYTVTAEDAVTEQEWTVMVTQEAEPIPGSLKCIFHNGKISTHGEKPVIRIE